jgi:hypothetical protein
MTSASSGISPTLRKISLKRAFSDLGLDFAALFPNAAPYAEHEWLVRTIPRVGLIVNAVVIEPFAAHPSYALGS